MDRAQREEESELLVFGYAAKLFRDDEKADWLERERHLIPWIGDPAVKIDRYDGRGALPDLESWQQEGPEPAEGVGLGETELERALEEERYRDLHEEAEYNEFSANYQEVEYRRLQSDVRREEYAAVGYSYEEEKKAEEELGTVMGPKLDDAPFQPPAGLGEVPNGVVVPKTMKIHSIIEKTAQFIAKNGSQMEIILKTKQSGNPLFNFLEYRDELNPYFKFLVGEIRDNGYVPVAEGSGQLEGKGKDEEENMSSEGEDDGYLHPSLFGGGGFRSGPPPAPFPPLPFNPSTGNSAYSLLVSKIKGSSANSTSPTPQSQAQGGQGEGGVNPNANGAPGQPHYAQPNQTPPANDQAVIEKMASYVVKNGVAFEELAKAKGDPRFLFLNPSHHYHWYYLNCKERFRAEAAAVVASRQFVSYAFESKLGSQNSASSGPDDPKRIILKAVELPLSASGIPIANMESISNRPATLPPEVASRIEQLKKKSAVFLKKETSPKIQFSSSIGKGLNLGGDKLAEDENENKVEVETAEPAVMEEVEVKEKEGDSTPVRKVAFISANNEYIEEEVPEPKEENNPETLKQRRRQKAALFLQQIKGLVKTDPVPVVKEEKDVLASSAKEEVEGILSDRNGNKDKLEVRLRRSSSKSKSPEEVEVTKVKRRPWSRSRSRSRNRSNSRTRSRSKSRKRSRSSSSTSSERKRKRSKRKSSKKGKKKHGRNRSRSRSRSSSRVRKKAKKHKH